MSGVWGTVVPWSEHAARVGSVMALAVTSQPASAIILRGRETRSENDSLILTDLYKRWLPQHVSLCMYRSANHLGGPLATSNHLLSFLIYLRDGTSPVSPKLSDLVESGKSCIREQV